MAKVRVHSLSMSADGYVAGPNQSVDDPLGEGGEQLHDWMFSTRTWRRMVGEEGGETGVDDDAAARGFEGIGAWIMGRNMFGPIRGEWTGDWKGWWGDNPPYHSPVYVLTHYAREPVEMEGGTVFHFVTDGIEAALERAREAAGDEDIRLLGGGSTVQQYLRAGLVDELNLAIAPMVLGGGARLFEEGVAEGYEVVEHATSSRAMHVRLERRR